MLDYCPLQRAAACGLSDETTRSFHAFLIRAERVCEARFDLLDRDFLARSSAMTQDDYDRAAAEISAAISRATERACEIAAEGYARAAKMERAQ